MSEIGSDQQPGGPRATIDDLLRSAVMRRAGSLALSDPLNHATVTGDPPRQLSFSQVDRAVSALASRLQVLGLPAGTVVGLQLPNTVESAIALLGLLRAGMIAAPLPLLWRKQDMVAALSAVGASAIITRSRIGAVAHADIACQAAAELLSIRQVCGFGRDLPDGVVSLDECLDAPPVNFAPPARAGEAADYVAVVTFETAPAGLIAVARNHTELIAGGLAALLEADIAEDTAVLSAIPLGSFAGIAVTLLPWLIRGGVLALHHGFDADTFVTQSHNRSAGTAVLPAPALAPLAEAGIIDLPIQNVIALWRAPEQLAASGPWRGTTALTDIACFGEIGLLAARRGASGIANPIPCGIVGAPRGGERSIVVMETARTKIGTLALRGPMVPLQAFPLGVGGTGGSYWTPDAEGFVDTRYACRRDRETETFSITGPPAGITSIGGYRFRQNDIDWQVAKADLHATIATLPDAMLGQRLAGSSPSPPATEARLQARGVNPLIAGAFHRRAKSQAA
jgi:hypothetical protein